jgi:GAF domain-containing protein
MAERSLHDAVAAGALAGEGSRAALLHSIVDVAREIFAARATSITLLDESTNELVFEAVSGEGSDTLVGQRFPTSQGIAGWVATSAQSLVLDDVAEDPRFSRDVAESTGYVPTALMAVPLIGDEDVLGVLSVLDRRDAKTFGLAQMELLELFAKQAAIALIVLQSARAADRALSGSGDAALVARVASAIEDLGGTRREAGVRLLSALEELLGGAGGRGDV